MSFFIITVIAGCIAAIVLIRKYRKRIRFEPPPLSDAYPPPSAKDVRELRNTERGGSEEPSMLKAVRSAADSQGLSIPEYMDSELQRILSSPWPTVDCLTESKTHRYADDTDLISTKDKRHLENCRECLVMLGLELYRRSKPLPWETDTSWNIKND